MRIWSIHPKYLDARGLVALWREALLAKHVLEGKTKGYKHHPQIERFRNAGNPLDSINQYLSEVYFDALRRGYNFNKTKINWKFRPTRLHVTSGQIEYETVHLLKKLVVRDKERYLAFRMLSDVQAHPLFKIRRGDIENWEVIMNRRQQGKMPRTSAGSFGSGSESSRVPKHR